MKTLLPGEVYFSTYADGGKRHRLIVVSSEPFNRGSYVTIVPTTSRRFHERAKQRNCVVFNKGAFRCFTEDCVAQAEMVTTVRMEQVDRSSGRIGRVGEKQVAELRAAIGHVLGTECVKAR